MSRIRLTAASGLMKLAQIPDYHSYLEIKYVQRLTSVIQVGLVILLPSYSQRLGPTFTSFTTQKYHHRRPKNVW